MINQTLINLSHSAISLDHFIQGAPLDVQPLTDDRPFFFNYQRGVPDGASTVFWYAAALLAILILSPLALKGRRPTAAWGDCPRL